MILDSFKRNSLTVLFCSLPFFAESYSTGWSNDFSYLQKNYSQIRTFENYLFPPQLENRREYTQITQLKTHSTLILKDGKIIYEKYAKGYHKHRPQKLWSVSKAVTNLLIGIAVRENKISIQDTICSYFKSYEMKFDCKKMTIKDILGWSSGLHWREMLTEPLSSSVFNMLYNKAGYKDAASFILSHPLIRKPGTSWHYSSGDTNLLMAILSQVYKPSEYAVLPWTKLFNELGIQSAVWETDSKGVFHGCCSLYMTTRDLARIGEFMLNKGRWLGKDFFPEDWINHYVQSISPAFLNDPVAIREQIVPSFQWWVNKPSRHKQVLKPRALQSAPEDLYLAIGYAGQLLFIIPSMNMVIVRTGSFDADVYLDTNALVGLALGIVTGKQYAQPIRQTFVPFSIGREYDSPRKYSYNSAGVMNNFLAKEMCSCMFVEGRNEFSCLEQFKPLKSRWQNISVSKPTKSVKVSALGWSAGRAHYSGRYGCYLH